MDKKITFKGKKIPRFKSYEEEANFWDTHSPLDYGTWKEVKLDVAKPLVHILGVRLDAKTIDELSMRGREVGVGASTLARMWILERLNTQKLQRKKSASINRSTRAVLHGVKAQ